jgi:hypothetical protein
MSSKENVTKKYSNELMEALPVPENVQNAIDTLSDEEWKLYLKNKDYLTDKEKADQQHDLS